MLDSPYGIDSLLCTTTRAGVTGNEIIKPNTFRAATQQALHAAHSTALILESFTPKNSEQSQAGAAKCWIHALNLWPLSGVECV